ncbi:response regulator transcription factor [Azospirillum sp. B4]|uniref:response regulator n=1 Tax=Azospirillum sp. B4 TaxID=95605 RepID=UPI000345BF02|nr:response regulator transcription factor [Azospirillum sp. B4]
MSTETTTATPSTGGPITVLLVEDDPPVRNLLAQRLAAAESLRLLDAVGTLAEARACCQQLRPAVLLTDLKLPDGSGIQLIRETRLLLPETEIMVISVLCDERSVVDAIGAGASGFLLKDALPEDLVNAVHDLVAGHSPISAAIARYIIRQVQGGNRPPAQTPHAPPSEAPPGNAQPEPPEGGVLSKREIDILWGIAKGMTYSAIAESLGISSHTVASHIKSIYRKLEVNSGREAVYEALARKLIQT